MADETEDSSKTEDASSRKLEEARAKGQVVHSREVTNWFAMLSIAAVVIFIAPPTVRSLAGALLKYIERPDQMRVDEALGEALLGTLGDVALALVIPLGLALLAGVGATVAQNGFVVAGERVRPKLEHISPLSGWKRLASMRNFVEFAKGIGKIALVAAVAFWLLAPEVDRLALTPTMEPAGLLGELHRLMVRLVIGVAGALAALAIADFAYQRFSFLRSMRMSKQEVKEEYRQVEGDPMIKGKLKQLRAERARKRMMAAVPEASVVITNPTHFAVALKYEMGEQTAPRVVAKGADVIAAKIREVATAHNVPLVENPPLARALYAAVEVDQEIPPEHYKAVAEVISYVFRLKGKLKPTAPPAGPPPAPGRQ
jgi:flagellar biosynthetic protein FlhB